MAKCYFNNGIILEGRKSVIKRNIKYIYDEFNVNNNLKHKFTPFKKEELINTKSKYL